MGLPRYTSYDKLAKKLRGRLNLGTGLPENSEINNTLNSLVAYNPSASSQTVDLELINDIAAQEESFIDLILSQLYILPFRFTSEVTVNIIGSISESFILSSLLSIHFQGTSPGIIASDLSQATTDWRRAGDMRLQMLIAGENIYYPSSQQVPPQNVNVPQQSAMVLPGEIRLGAGSRPDLLSRNYSFVSKRNTQSGGNFFNDRCSGCQTRPDGTSLGSIPKTYDICNPNNPYPDYEVFQ
jgi:hypothetical protein